jgi:hypothetical protein
MCAEHKAKFERIDNDRAMVEQALYKLYKEINVIRIPSMPKKRAPRKLKTLGGGVTVIS